MGDLSTGETAAILIPLLAIELGLVIWALVDLSKRERVKGGSKLLWVIIILFIQLLGSILYLVWGREE